MGAEFSIGLQTALQAAGSIVGGAGLALLPGMQGIGIATATLGASSAIASGASSIVHLRESKAAQGEIEAQQLSQHTQEEQLKAQQRMISNARSGTYGKESQRAANNFIAGLAQARSVNGGLALGGINPALNRALDRGISRAAGKILEKRDGIDPQLVHRFGDPLYRMTVHAAKTGGRSMRDYQQDNLHAAATNRLIVSGRSYAENTPQTNAASHQYTYSNPEQDKFSLGNNLYTLAQAGKVKNVPGFAGTYYSQSPG